MCKYNFQYCAKIVVFSEDKKNILLCQRTNEEDLNNIFTPVQKPLAKPEVW